MSLENMVVALAQTAKKAARILATVSTHTKNQALLAAAQQLREQTEVLLVANAQDVARGKDNDLSAALLDRLTLNQARIEAMATGLEIMVDLPDPVEETVCDLEATKWPGDQSGPCPARRCRDYLRVTAECHGRCRRPVSQGWQCGCAERRVGGVCDQ